MNHYVDKIEKNRLLLLVLTAIAYFFSIGVRMYWPIHFSDMASMYHSGELMINTNDGYYFATGARDLLNGFVASDAQRLSASHASPGLVLLTAFLTKFTPFSLETVILYLPAIISSLIVVPIILTGRLIGHTFLGFLAALLGSIAWSYYNRTMVGYYDTDMFSVLLQFSILYALLHVAYRKDMKDILLAAFLIFAYPYFYPQGMSIVYAMFMMFVGYLLLEYKGIIQTKETTNIRQEPVVLYSSIILLSIPLMITLPIAIRILLFLVAFVMLVRKIPEERLLFYMAIAAFLGFLYFGNVFTLILSKVLVYADRGVQTEGLHFFQVVQTVREAGAIPMSVIANRISGSSLGLVLGLIGYIVLLFKHKPFMIALPLIGVGMFAYIGGLRFTVYAVPVVALGAVYLFWVIGAYLNNKRFQLLFVSAATALMLYPNIKHIVAYKVPTVLNSMEVKDLESLKKVASDKDYTLAWWDYGYPIWFYSNTNTLIDGGKHQNDNFIISTILQTDSQDLAANLSRLAVETYVKNGYRVVTDTLFKNKKQEQRDPNFFLEELKDPDYPLPAKTRDIYLYLPYRMMNIFPTVAIFGNIDLTTGKSKRKIVFIAGRPIQKQQDWILLSNGISINMRRGLLRQNGHNIPMSQIVVTQTMPNGHLKKMRQNFHQNSGFSVVYLRDYNTIVMMDNQTFNSTYVQMFMLENYDHDLFELISRSPYTKIYKLKK